MDILYNRDDPNVITVNIPDIGVEDYYIWRLDGTEDEFHFSQRAMCHAHELIRRHAIGEPYPVGYRRDQPGHLRLVLHRSEEGGKRLFEKVLGINEDYVEITP